MTQKELTHPATELTKLPGAFLEGLKSLQAAQQKALGEMLPLSGSLPEFDPMGGALSRLTVYQRVLMGTFKAQWDMTQDLASIALNPQAQGPFVAESLAFQQAFFVQLHKLTDAWVTGLSNVAKSADAANHVSTVDKLAEAEANTSLQLVSLISSQATNLATLLMSAQVGFGLLLDKHGDHNGQI